MASMLVGRRSLLALAVLFMLSACVSQPLTVSKQGDYSISVPQGWETLGSGVHSFSQGDGGCFSFVDKKNKSVELARLCSGSTWDDVPERARQLVLFGGDSFGKYESKTTAGGAKYHVFSMDDLGVESIILEGKGHLLRIDVLALPPDNQKVADVLISLFDSVLWKENRSRYGGYKVAENDILVWFYRGPITGRALCEAIHAADVAQIRALTNGKKLDLSGRCSTQGPSFLSLVAAFDEEAWQKIQPLISEDQRLKLLNARLGNQISQLPRLLFLSPEYHSKRIAKISRLVDDGALPLDSKNSVDWPQIGALLLAPEESGFEYARESSQLVLRILDKLPEEKGESMRLGDYFSDVLLKKNKKMAPVPERLQLDILRRLKAKYEHVVFWPDENAIGDLLSDQLSFSFSDQLLKAVASLEPVALGDADTIALAIARDKLALLEIDLKKNIWAMSQEKCRVVVDAAREKAHATGDGALLNKLLHLQKLKAE